MFWSLTFGFNITLASMIPYSSVVIDVDSCCVVIALTLLVILLLKKHLTMNPIAITQLKNCETMFH